jgi:hypothetical protein
MLLISSGKPSTSIARDAAMPEVTQALRDARDLLLVTNRDNPKALGDFGYAVDDSPQAKAKAKPPSPAPF